MLTSLQIKNFKSWADTGEIRLAPLTVIFGANSSGKSSLGHLLLALKQTVLSADRKRPLHLGDDSTLVDLGTFEECIHNHRLDETLSFKIAWTLPKELVVKDPILREQFGGDELELRVGLRASSTGQPSVTNFEYEMRSAGKSVLTTTHGQTQKGDFDLNAYPYKLVRAPGRVWPLDTPDKFYRVSDQTRARFQNAAFFADLALETEAALTRIHHLGPLRDHPRRFYQWSGDMPEDVGQRGELAIPAILAAVAAERRLSSGYRQRQKGFEELVAYWLKQLGIIDSFEVKPIAAGRKEYEVLVRTRGSRSEVKITDVGFGVSQVLPALVQAFYAPANSTIWMEQPEIHLHPQVQAELADVFISAIQSREDGKPRNTQLIVESHSEHFLNRLQRRIAEEAISVDDIAVYFAKTRAGATYLDELRVDSFGEIENWPDNFFGDEMEEIAARSKAAIQRKIRERDEAKG